MRIRKGRDVERLLDRLMPDHEVVVVPEAVRRPTVAAFRRTLAMTPEERIDKAFALREFALSLRREIARSD